MPVLLVADSFDTVLLELIALEDFIAFEKFFKGTLAKENHLSIFGIPAVTITKELPGEDTSFFEGGVDILPSGLKIFWPKKGEYELSTDKIKLTLRKMIVLDGYVLELEVFGHEFFGPLYPCSSVVNREHLLKAFSEKVFGIVECARSEIQA